MDREQTSRDDDDVPNPYRDHPDQYLFADRDFAAGDRAVFVGPPDEEYQPGLMPWPAEHKLHRRRGVICVGISESIRCYPDDPEDSKYWVRFDGDPKGPRQVAATWLVKEYAFRDPLSSGLPWLTASHRRSAAGT